MDPEYVPFTGEFGGRQLHLPPLTLWDDWRIFVADESRAAYAGPWLASNSTLGLTDCRILIEVDRHMLPSHLYLVTGPLIDGLKESLHVPHEIAKAFVPLSSALSHTKEGICGHCCGFGMLPLMSLSTGGLLDLVPCAARYAGDYFGDPISTVGDPCPQTSYSDSPFQIHGTRFAGWNVLRLLMLGGCEVASEIQPYKDGDGVLPFRFHGGRGVVRPLKIKEGPTT